MVDDADRKQLLRQYRKQLVKPLEEVGMTIGELEATIRLQAESELEIASQVIGAIDLLTANHIDQTYSRVAKPIAKIHDRINAHIRGELGTIGELLDSVPWSREIKDQTDSTGYRHGSDDRTAAERATESHKDEACPAVVVSKPQTTGSKPQVSPPPQTQTTSSSAESAQPKTQSTQADRGKPDFTPIDTGAANCSINQYSVDELLKSLKSYSVSEAVSSTISSVLSSGFTGVLDTGLVLPVVNVVIDAVLKSVSTLVGRASDVQRDQLNKSGCTTDQFGAIVSVEAILGFLNKYLLPDISQITLPLEYARNSFCPVEFPSGHEATEAFLANALTTEELTTWWKQNNLCVEPQQRMLEARRSKPVPQELIVMRRRGLISESEYNAAMRRLGYLNGADTANIYKLSEELPPISELIRYMVRDVADEEVVRHFNFDALYDKKFTGFLKAWAEQQGIPDQYTKAAWRAHWILPGPGQLYTMYQRLRKLPDGDPRKTTQDDIEQALRHNDVLPFWIPKLIAVSFRPLTRIDLRRAYNAGAITLPDVELGYSQLGYDDDNAARLAKFTDTLRNQSILNAVPLKLWRQEIIDADEAFKRLQALNYPAAVINDAMADAAKMQRNNSAVKQYGKQLLSRPDAEAKLTKHGIPKAVFDIWLNDIDALHKARVNIVCTKSLMKRYEHGEFDPGQLLQRVIAIGIPAANAELVVREAQCSLAAKGKDPSTAQLCDWMDRGLIQPPEFIARLQRLGWSEKDSMAILVQCSAKNGAANANRAAKIAKEDAVAQKKLDQMIQRQATAIAKQQAESDRKNKQAAAVRQKREGLLLDAADKLRSKIVMTLQEGAQLLRTEKTRVQTAYSLSVDDAIAAIVTAVEDYDSASGANFADSVDDAAKAIIDLQDQLA